MPLAQCPELTLLVEVPEMMPLVPKCTTHVESFLYLGLTDASVIHIKTLGVA